MPDMAERLNKVEELLERLVEESEEACSARATIATSLATKEDAATKVPAWVWPLISLAITVFGAVYVTGQFNGKFEEFRMAVYQRLDRLERMGDSERHRAPDNYVSPPIGRTP